ncbi:protein C-ets-1-like isoform X2 [Glandiceps talaboti]
MQYAQSADVVPGSRDMTGRLRYNDRPHTFQALRVPIASMFPQDPRDWARDDVISWLLWATDYYKLGQVDVEKFHMNGRGLIYLNKEGFERRAPSAGEKLFDDFRRRFARAIIAEKNAHYKI